MHSWEMKFIPFFELPPFCAEFFCKLFRQFLHIWLNFWLTTCNEYTDNYLKFKYFTTFLNVSLPQTKNYWFWLTSPKDLPSPPFLHPSFLLFSHFKKMVIPPFDIFEKCYPLFWRGWVHLCPMYWYIGWQTKVCFSLARTSMGLIVLYLYNETLKYCITYALDGGCAV